MFENEGTLYCDCFEWQNLRRQSFASQFKTIGVAVVSVNASHLKYENKLKSKNISSV